MSIVFGVLVFLVICLVAFLVADEARIKTNFVVIPAPPSGWDTARSGDEPYGGTVPGWGEDYTYPPF